MTNENLTAKELTIDAIKAIFLSDDKVLCHEIEVESYFCHRVDKKYNVSIKKVTMSISGGKPNNLYVVCHYNDNCHVMNVNDMILSVPEDAVKKNLRGE